MSDAPWPAPIGSSEAMETQVEVSSAAARERRQVSADRLVVGRSQLSDVALPADPLVSRTHAVLERIADRWILRDVGSRNGTYVNDVRVRDAVRVRPGDTIRIGRSVLVLRTHHPVDDPEATERRPPPPVLTPRERDVLLAVARPLMAAGPFRQPASTGEIARSLWVSNDAVKRHLSNLYRKFGIDGRGASRQSRLATAALQRGAITLVEIRQVA
jgi:pSer/pThr/pTyr-binding forkhead associated (FHA) protein